MDGTGHQRFKVLCTFILIVASFPEKVLCSVTVEEGMSATLQCPGFTPTPGGDQSAIFNWFKAREGDKNNDNRVAFLAKRDGVVNSERDLAGRATIDSTTGALHITQTRVSDDHVYACRFVFTSNGTVQNETHLTITVTPSEEDLRVMATPPGPVPVGISVTLKCSVSRVRPPPRLMYWQFSDEPHFENYRHVTNSDGLTSSVSVQYSLTVSRSHHGRKLVCHYVSSRYISSEEMTIQVLSKPIGKPSLKSNKTAVKVNSKVDLKCDSSQVDGSATWFAWQFVNGTTLGNTTQPMWTYFAKEKEETIQFVCIAGNSLGQSNTSEPFTITVQNPGGQLIGVAIGTTIGVLMAAVAVAVPVYLCRKRRNAAKENRRVRFDGNVVKSPSKPAKENPSVYYDEIDPADVGARRTKDEEAIYQNEGVLPTLSFQPPLGTRQPPQDDDSAYEKPIAAPVATYEPFGDGQGRGRGGATSAHKSHVGASAARYEQLRKSSKKSKATKAEDENPTYLEVF